MKAWSDMDRNAAPTVRFPHTAPGLLGTLAHRNRMASGNLV